MRIIVHFNNGWPGSYNSEMASLNEFIHLRIFLRDLNCNRFDLRVVVQSVLS